MGREGEAGSKRQPPAMASKQSFANPMMDDDSDDETELGEGLLKMANPMASSSVDGEEEEEEGMSAAQMIAANESQMTDDELEDLTYVSVITTASLRIMYASHLTTVRAAVVITYRRSRRPTSGARARSTTRSSG